MTEKQEKIVSSALRLFAEQGYASTSTSKVAKEAGVSEGLIFRHFKNKEGLLRAILSQGQEKVNDMFRSLESVNDPKEVIRRIIELPFSIEEDQKAFWKLLYALKWQANVYDDGMSKPMKKVLMPAFEKLNYTNPAAEAELILILIDGLAVAVLLRKPEQIEVIKQSILNKYHI